MNQTKEKVDVYALVTQLIIEQLKNGIIPWQKPWTGKGLPQNMVTKRPYRGINVWLLSSLNYPTNYYLSFKQVKEMGGSVKKGEKSHLVIFWKWLDHTDEETGETVKTPLLRYYTVFNVDQCTGIEEWIPKIEERLNEPIELCESIVSKMPQLPKIQFKESEAYYHPLEDYVNMPKQKTFVDSESYYTTLFHELIHSTGHFKRLNRKEVMQTARYGGDLYSVEELVAEIGACYLTSYAGIAKDQFKNNVAYIAGWLEVLRDDKRFIVYACAQAQKAADFILNTEFGEKEETESEN